MQKKYPELHFQVFFIIAQAPMGQKLFSNMNILHTRFYADQLFGNENEKRDLKKKNFSYHIICQNEKKHFIEKMNS